MLLQLQHLQASPCSAVRREPELQRMGWRQHQSFRRTRHPKSPEIKKKEAVVASYKNLGIVQVSGYLNMRETASTDGNIIGKLMGDSACEIVDDSTEGWYQVESGGISGYISSEFVLTGDEAKKKALELVEKRALITADSLNIRKEPNTESEVVGQALKNERYVVEGEPKNGFRFRAVIFLRIMRRSNTHSMRRGSWICVRWC